MAGRGKQTQKVETPFPSVHLVQFENSPYWWIRFWKKERRQSFFRSTETVDQARAMALLPEIYQEFLKNPDANSKTENATVSEMIDAFLAFHEQRVKRKEIKQSTFEVKQCSLRSGMLKYLLEFGFFRVKELNFERHFKDYCSWRKGLGYKHSTVKEEVKIIKEFANWLFKNGLIKDATCNIPIPRQTHEAREEEQGEKAFTEEQVKAIRGELERRIEESEGVEVWKWKQMLYFFELQLEGGFRTDELFNIQFGDIKYKSNGETLVDVRVSKTGRRNTIFLSQTVPKVIALFKSKKVDPKSTTSLWMDFGTRKQWSSQFFSRRFREILTAVGLGLEYRMYCCRATHITRRIHKGVSTYLLAKNLGTSEMMIHKHYEDVIIENENRVLLGMTDKKMDVVLKKSEKEVFIPLV